MQVSLHCKSGQHQTECKAVVKVTVQFRVISCKHADVSYLVIKCATMFKRIMLELCIMLTIN